MSSTNPSKNLEVSEGHQLGKDALPRHVAIIMDGNGRWANERGLNRVNGHKKGVETAQKIIKRAAECDIEYLTLFAFSSENWSRPASEVNELMRLLRNFVRRGLAELHKSGIKVVMIGSRDGIDSQTLKMIDKSVELTQHNTRMTLVMAFNYGSQNEIVRATRTLVGKALAGDITAEEIDERVISEHLDTGNFPNPDLLIRTSGEKRLSNFLLWQAAYSEFVFVDCYWPDFEPDKFDAALVEYASRNRRFGGVDSKVS